MPSGRPSRPTRYGEIVLVADLVDPQGRNSKDRPCVVVTDPRVSLEGREIVLAISTIVPDPPPPDHVLLPWQQPRHPVTGLNKRNAAICTWVAEIEDGRILRKLGTVPGRQLHAIATVLNRLAGGEA